MRQKPRGDDERKGEPAPPLALGSDCRVFQLIVQATASSVTRGRIADATAHRNAARLGTGVLGWCRPDGRVRRIAGGRTGGLEVKTRELRARADAELAEDVAEVGGDRARAEEELRS